ncbi:MAG: DUF2029 domain-containing protein [Treponema sp.]|nr:DUF2029 domain-containing protein [Treponema sp.]
MSNKNKFVYYFSAAITAALFLHLFAFALAKGNGTQLSIFSMQLHDFGADFFNQLRYIAERDPYFNEINGAANHSWPPLPWLLLFPLSQLQPYASMSLQDCWSSPVSEISLLLFMTMISLIFAHALKCLCKKWNVPEIIMLAFFSSYIYINTVERGNIIVLSAACVTYFITYYDSDDKKLRFFACFSLAFAATMKIYPIFFSFLLFEKKQYKEIAWGAMWCVLLGLLPFLFFKHGLGNIPRLLLLNTRVFPKAYPIVNGGFTCANIVHMILSNIHVPHARAFATIFGNGIRFIAFLGLLLSLFEKNFFRRYSLILFAVMMFPGWSGGYTALYLFPMILYCISLISKTDNNKCRYSILIYTALYLLLEPFQIRIGAHHLNFYFLCIIPLSFFLCVFAYSVINFFKTRTCNHANYVSHSE